MIIKLTKNATEKHINDAITRQTENKLLTFGSIGNTYVDGVNVSYWMLTNKVVILTNN